MSWPCGKNYIWDLTPWVMEVMAVSVWNIRRELQLMSCKLYYGCFGFYLFIFILVLGSLGILISTKRMRKINMNFKDLIYLNILFLLINLKFKDVKYMNKLIWVYEIYLKIQ